MLRLICHDARVELMSEVHDDCNRGQPVKIILTRRFRPSAFALLALLLVIPEQFPSSPTNTDASPALATPPRTVVRLGRTHSASFNRCALTMSPVSFNVAPIAVVSPYAAPGPRVVVGAPVLSIAPVPLFTVAPAAPAYVRPMPARYGHYGHASHRGGWKKHYR